MRRTSVFRLTGWVILILIAGSGSAAAVDGAAALRALLPLTPSPLQTPTLPPLPPGPVLPSPGTSPTASTGPQTAWARPASDAAGAAVVVEGAHWKPSTPVYFYFDRNDTSSFVQAHPDRGGRFAVCFTLPERSIGSHTWRLCQDCGLPTENKASVPFTVTSASSRQSRDPRCASPPSAAFNLPSDKSATPRPTSSPTKPAVDPNPAPLPPPGHDVASSAKRALDLQTERGYIAFNPVRQMRVADRERVEVNIRRALSEDLTDTVKQQLSEGLGKEGKVEFDTLSVGDVMIVRLDENDSFTIDPITQERQVLGDDVTTWAWDVTPRTAGRHSLVLCVEVEILLEDRRLAPQGSCKFEREIEVKVNPLASTSSFMTRNWQWLVGGPIGTAVFAWLAREGWLKRKRNPSGEGSSPQESGS